MSKNAADFIMNCPLFIFIDEQDIRFTYFIIILSWIYFLETISAQIDVNYILIVVDKGQRLSL